MLEVIEALAWITILLLGIVMILGLTIVITAEIGVIQRMKGQQRQPELQVGPFQPYEVTRRR
jgi:hypothetical protein